jgi:hypothetical protein
LIFWLFGIYAELVEVSKKKEQINQLASVKHKKCEISLKIKAKRIFACKRAFLIFFGAARENF